MVARLSGVGIHDFGTTFKAYRREVIHNIPLYGEMHRFILRWRAGTGRASARSRSVTRAAARAEPLRLSRTVGVFFDLADDPVPAALHDAAAALLRDDWGRGDDRWRRTGGMGCWR